MIIDVLRATTTISTALDNGANHIVPVEKPEDCTRLKANNYVCAAERNGIKLDGFDFGNSPQEFTKDSIGGKNIALTTTNGTRAMIAASSARNILVGSFLNLNALSLKIKDLDADLILFCAGWKNKFNLEDTVFAGAVIEQLKSNFEIADDSSFAALDLWLSAKANLADYLQKANHVQRFKTLDAESDLDVCLKIDSSAIVPVFRDGKIFSL